MELFWIIITATNLETQFTELAEVVPDLGLSLLVFRRLYIHAHGGGREDIP